jgi:hypothetical protein
MRYTEIVERLTEIQRLTKGREWIERYGSGDRRALRQ